MSTLTWTALAVALVTTLRGAPRHARPLPGVIDPASRPTRPPTARPTARPIARPIARHRRRDIESALPDAIELVVAAARAGYLPITALDAALPHLSPAVRPAFAHVVHRVEQGERFADALDSLPSLLGPPAIALAQSLAAADRDGLPLVPVLDRLADEARQRRRRHAETLARQVPIRMSIPLVLCTLPSFVLLAVVPLLLAALSSLTR